MQINQINWSLPTKNSTKEQEWQTGNYARKQEFALNFPDAILFLSKLWDIAPIQLLIDFSNHLSGTSCDREGNDKAKEHLLNYIHEMGYGQQLYTPEHIRQMLSELDAVDRLCPVDAENKIIETYINWSKTYLDWWFKKWRQEVETEK